MGVWLQRDFYDLQLAYVLGPAHFLSIHHRIIASAKPAAANDKSNAMNGPPLR